MSFNPMQDQAPYTNVRNRVDAFLNEEEGWDGSEGKPASAMTAKHALQFLDLAEAVELPAPSACLGLSGDIGLVWNQGGLYITCKFSDREHYFFGVFGRFTADTKAYGTPAVTALPDDLVNFVRSAHAEAKTWEASTRHT